MLKTLTDACVKELKGEAREYTVRDRRVGGLGIRVRPSGYRSWVVDVVIDGRPRRLTLGAFHYMGCDEARRLAMGRLQEIQESACGHGDASPSGSGAGGASADMPSFSEFARETWWPQYTRGRKPTTKRRTGSELRSNLLPVFGEVRLDAITKAMVVEWFERKSRTMPGAANHALVTLGTIMGSAVEHGLVKNNPARNIKKNPGRKMTRFLSKEEMVRLNMVMDKYVAENPSMQVSCDIVRLLMLTGCRKGEIMGLRWDEVGADRLNLSDSKTGARKVWLNEQAAQIIASQPRGDGLQSMSDGSHAGGGGGVQTGGDGLQAGGSDFVFPSPYNPDKPRDSIDTFWYSVRKEAGLRDVRLHDLRHTFASHAVMEGIPLPMVARLLGHSNVSMTMRYAHISDAITEEAAEMLGVKIGELIMGDEAK